MTPTSAQLLKCYIVCRELTWMYLAIQMVSIDEPTGDLFILAGEDLEVYIHPNGDSTFNE